MKHLLLNFLTRHNWRHLAHACYKGMINHVIWWLVQAQFVAYVHHNITMPAHSVSCESNMVELLSLTILFIAGFTIES